MRTPSLPTGTILAGTDFEILVEVGTLRHSLLSSILYPRRYQRKNGINGVTDTQGYTANSQQRMRNPFDEMESNGLTYNKQQGGGYQGVRCEDGRSEWQKIQHREEAKSAQ